MNRRPSRGGGGGGGGPGGGPQWWRRPSWLRVAGAAALLVIAVGALGAYVGGSVLLADTPQIPPRAQLWALRRSPGMTFYDRSGKLIATRGAKYGQVVTLKELPPYVPLAFLAAEDRRFYQHGPVDLHAIARALTTDLRAGRSREGASTITQQLARTLFLRRDPSLKRKLQEAYLAWELERALSKDEVFELYLNRTYFGEGAYGLDAASQTYFGKPASQLNLVEAATLAGLPNAPSRLALTNDLPDALARAHKILATMRQENWISEPDLVAALGTNPVLAPAHGGEGDYGDVIDLAAAQATQLTGGETPDLVVRTTIDTGLESVGADALKSVVAKEGAHRGVSQGALVALAPDGAILALVGGVDHSAFNRVTQAHRQPGSSFKAFVYGAAMEHGLTPTSVRVDGPVKYGDWNPENYGHAYLGPVTLQEALARSLNTVSVRLTLEVGASTVADFARRLGLADLPPNPGPSIALGAYEVTPIEMAAGYQVFQTGGGRTTPYLVTEVRSTRGDVLYTHAASAALPVFDPLYATRMVTMMKTVITAGTGTGANIDRPAAGKTGTSQNWRDAWFIGFTPDVLAAVWVGNDNGAPMAKVTGGELPAEIWKRFMTAAEKGLPARDFPWLVPEPPETPVLATASAPGAIQGPYQDQPGITSSAPRSGGPRFGGPYVATPDPEAAGDQPPPPKYDRDAPGGPVDRWVDRPPPDRWVDEPPPSEGPDADAPPPPPPRHRIQPETPAESPADGGPRYRY